MGAYRNDEKSLGKMPKKKVFISYSHKQSNWVKTRLAPVLEAGGAEVLIDYREFNAGKRVIGQMDAAQDKANVHLLLFSPAYLNSNYCRHEMNRARQYDPDFKKGKVLPVIRKQCNLPRWLTQFNPPLHIDLQNDKDAASWDMLMAGCKATLGIAVPDWLKARDEICRYIKRDLSVNLVVTGKPKWNELLTHIRKEYFNDFGMIDVENPAVNTRKALVEEILAACNAAVKVPAKKGEDLVTLGRALANRQHTGLIFKHFHQVTGKQYYDLELFSALRYLIMESRNLVLLIQSRKTFIELLPPDHPLSSITTMKTVELRG